MFLLSKNLTKQPRTWRRQMLFAQEGFLEVGDGGASPTSFF
jgi:hypothetical protein